MAGGYRLRVATAGLRATIRNMRLFILLCVCATLVAVDAEPAAVNSGGLRLADDRATADWVRERIQKPLRQHCAECHMDGKRKGGYVMDDYTRLIAGGHNFPAAIKPWDTETSPLLRAVRWEIDDDLNMPPDEQLSAEIIADLTRWVAMGAPWPDESIAPTEVAPRTEPPAWFGRWHPVAVHLPLGAILIALLLEVVALAKHPCRLHPGTSWTLGATLVGTITAIATGLVLEGGQNPELLESHERLGWITGVVIVAAFALSFFGTRSSRWRWAVRLLILAGALLAGTTGHAGGEMTWGEGWLW